MAKALTKSQVAATVAEGLGLTKKQGAQALDLLAQLAYKHAKDTFTLPGIGKLVLVKRKARMGRNPTNGYGDQDSGEEGGQSPGREGRQGYRALEDCRDRGA